MFIFVSFRDSISYGSLASLSGLRKTRKGIQCRSTPLYHLSLPPPQLLLTPHAPPLRPLDPSLLDPSEDSVDRERNGAVPRLGRSRDVEVLDRGRGGGGGADTDPEGRRRGGM